MTESTLFMGISLVLASQYSGIYMENANHRNIKIRLERNQAGFSDTNE